MKNTTKTFRFNKLSDSSLKENQSLPKLDLTYKSISSRLDINKI